MVMDVSKAFGRSGGLLGSPAHWAPVFVRLIVGYGFLAHGYAKIARGPEHFAEILAAIGVPAPHLMSFLTIMIEVVGGAAVLFGAYVPWVAAPMAAVLVVAAVTVHLRNGFSSIKLLSVTKTGAHFGQPGYETDLLYLACLAALVLGGTGALSIGNWLQFPRAPRGGPAQP
jgi:putative oxidoreductase